MFTLPSICYLVAACIIHSVCAAAQGEHHMPSLEHSRNLIKGALEKYEDAADEGFACMQTEPTCVSSALEDVFGPLGKFTVLTKYHKRRAELKNSTNKAEALVREIARTTQHFRNQLLEANPSFDLAVLRKLLEHLDNATASSKVIEDLAARIIVHAEERPFDRKERKHLQTMLRVACFHPDISPNKILCTAHSRQDIWSSDYARDVAKHLKSDRQMLVQTALSFALTLHRILDSVMICAEIIGRHPKMPEDFDRVGGAINAAKHILQMFEKAEEVIVKEFYLHSIEQDVKAFDGQRGEQYGHRANLILGHLSTKYKWLSFLVWEAKAITNSTSKPKICFQLGDGESKPSATTTANNHALGTLALQHADDPSLMTHVVWIRKHKATGMAQITQCLKNYGTQALQYLKANAWKKSEECNKFLNDLWSCANYQYLVMLCRRRSDKDWGASFAEEAFLANQFMTWSSADWECVSIFGLKA